MTKKSSGRGQLSAMPTMKQRPALVKVSEARVNQGITAQRGEYKPGKSK